MLMIMAGMFVPIVCVVVAIMGVVVAFVVVCPFRLVRLGSVFEGVGRTQRFAFQARRTRQSQSHPFQFLPKATAIAARSRSRLKRHLPRPAPQLKSSALFPIPGDMLHSW
jgi:hypothetical protein